MGIRIVNKRELPASPASPAPLPEWSIAVPVNLPELEPAEVWEVPSADPGDDFDDDENEANWRNIDPDVFAYLTSPRNYPEPCGWCGGRTRHSQPCIDLRLSWAPVMPWGQHKGKALPELPISYLHHLKTSKRGNAELQSYVIEEWNRRTTA